VVHYLCIDGARVPREEEDDREGSTSPWSREINSSRQQWCSTSWPRRQREHHQYIEDEERLEMTSYTIDTIPGTPLYLTEFDGTYIRDFDEEMLMRPPVDNRQHSIIDYSKS
jgi:hypothetical protein